MNIKIEGWKVTLHNENGDRLQLKGEFEADFFKEYQNKQLIIADVSTRYSYSEIEEILKSQIDYMIECVQDSQGTIDPSKDINDIEMTLKILKHVYNVC